MKFYELKKGEAFIFKGEEYTFYSAGADGAYGRYVVDKDAVGDFEQYEWCSPVEEVVKVV